MIKKLSALIFACVAIVLPVLAQQGFKISQYPRITTIPGTYLFVVANPGLTNYSMAYSDLAAQLTQNISLENATNNDMLTSNQLFTLLYNTMVTYVNSATNPFSGGSFILTLNGYGTNLNLFGTNVVTLLQATEIDATNLVFTSATPNTSAMFDSLNELISVPNAVGIMTNDGAGNIGFSATATAPIDTTTITVINLYASTNFSTNFYSTVAYITTLYAQTNFSTNLYFVSGKGNTLIITNNLQLQYVAASSLVATDGANNLTNAGIAARFTFTGNVLDIASGSIPNADLANSSITIQNSAVSLGGSTLEQGSKPVFDLQSSTNLLLSSISSPTNGVSTASSIDFTLSEDLTNIAGAVSQTSIVNFNQTNINHHIRWYVNRTGSDQTITVGTWETDSGRTSATTYTCTNNTTLGLMFTMYAGQFTNVASMKTFR